MAYDIGTARGVIEMDYNGRGVEQAQEDLTGLEKSGQQGSAALAGAGKAATRAGLVIAAGLGAGVYAAANFEERMSAIGAVSGATGQELDALRDKALQLGKDTSFSASESAQAMEELVKAGLSVDDVLNGAADATVALAAAGGVDMPTAATIASNAMNQFNLNAKDMVGVVDDIAGAANASAIDVNDFGMSLSQVGAVANLVGLSFKDTSTAIALMGNAGIKGSDAGTSLKTMLMNLQPTTEKQIGLFKELGIMTENGKNQFFNAQGEIKNMAGVAGVLNKALDGMSKKQKSMALETMFGSDAIRAAAVIADEGAAGFRKMQKEMGEVSAADVAAKRLDNFKGSIEALKGSLETLGITVGTALLPFLRDLVDGLTTAANWFLNLSESTQKFAVGSLVAAAGILLIVGKLIQFYLWTQKIARALAITRLAFASTWVAALGPIALIIAAIAAVVVIIILLWKKSETFRDIVLGVWDAIKSAAMAVASWFAGPFVNFFTSAWDAIVSALKAVGGFFKAIWDGIKSAAQAAWSAITSVVSTGIAFVKQVIMTGVAVIRSIWNAFWGTFGGVIKAAFGLIIAIVRLGWVIIKGLFLAALLGLKAITMTIWNAIAFGIRAAWAVIKAVVMTGVNTVRAVITGVWNAIRAVTSAVWNGIMAVIRAVWGVIGSTVMRGVNAVKSAISAAWNTVKSITSSAWSAIKNAVSDGINAMMSLVSGIKDRITGALSGAASWLYDAGRAIIQGLLNGIESLIGAVTDKIDSVAGAIGKFLPGSPVKEGPLKVLNRGHAGKEIVNMIIAGLDEMSPALESALAATMPAVPVPAGLTVPAGLAATPSSAASGSGSGGLRLVEGELTLDPNGRAFIRGVAVDADDDDADFDDLLGRMG